MSSFATSLVSRTVELATQQGKALCGALGQICTGDPTDPQLLPNVQFPTWTSLRRCLCTYPMIFPLLGGCQELTLSTRAIPALTQCPLDSAATALLPSWAASPPAVAPTTPPSKAVGRLPALGWNTWNAYRCAISEEKVFAAAQSFVTLGLRDAGYEYVNIDDCWALCDRDPKTNEQVVDPIKFPHGMKALADRVHSLGLKIGIYSDAGTNTCEGYPGSLGYEAVDAATWQSWGIDYLKYDNCNVPANWSDTSAPPGDDWYNSNSAKRFRSMGAAIANNDPPMEYSLCIWGDAQVWTWGARVGHSWRMQGDSSPTWEYIKSIIKKNVEHLSAVDFFAHNDMDMMEIGNGNGNLTTQEQRTHFAVWAFMKSPILLGTELSQLSSEEVEIITNRELLAFHQDATVGKPAMPYNSSTIVAADPPQIYSGMSTKGAHVFIVNTNDTSATFNINFADVPGLHSTNGHVHDMWTSKDLGIFSGSYDIALSAHDTAAVLITPVKVES